MKKGFTLLEVLVALSVLSVFMLGIYGLLQESVKFTQASVNRINLVDEGYERIIKSIHYPNVALGYQGLTGDKAEFTEYRTPTLIPQVNSVKLEIKTSNAVLVYEYFEKSK